MAYLFKARFSLILLWKDAYLITENSKSAIYIAIIDMPSKKLNLSCCRFLNNNKKQFSLKYRYRIRMIFICHVIINS
jgi:hypothetical protein